MGSYVLPFGLAAGLLLLGMAIAGLAVPRPGTRKQVPGTWHAGGLGATRMAGALLLLVVLMVTGIYCLAYAQRHLAGHFPASLQGASMSPDALKTLEVWTRAIQKSVLFYAIVLIIPLVSSRRFKALGIDEDASKAFLTWYSLCGSLLHPLVFRLSGGLDLGHYLTDVLSMAETLLLSSLYLLVLSKIHELHDVLSYAHVVTRFEIEEVLCTVKPRVIGILAYLCFDAISGAATVVAGVLPSGNMAGFAANGAVKVLLLLALYYYSVNFLVSPANGVCESIQRMESIKRHVASGVQGLDGGDGDDLIDIAAIPSI